MSDNWTRYSEHVWEFSLKVHFKKRYLMSWLERITGLLLISSILIFQDNTSVIWVVRTDTDCGIIAFRWHCVSKTIFFYCQCEANDFLSTIDWKWLAHSRILTILKSDQKHIWLHHFDDPNNEKNRALSECVEVCGWIIKSAD